MFDFDPSLDTIEFDVLVNHDTRKYCARLFTSTKGKRHTKFMESAYYDTEAEAIEEVEAMIGDLQQAGFMLSRQKETN